VYRGRYEEIATYTGLDGTTGTAFTIVAGGFTLTDGVLDLGQTFVPSSSRDDIGLSIGTRAAELDVTMAAAVSQHLEPIQINLNFIGSAPTSTSTVNAMYMQLTHDTTDMPNLRLKGADWTMTINKDLQDAYIFQGEIDFGSGINTIGGEAAVLGLTMNSGSGTLTGNRWGIVCVTTGSAGQTASLFLSHRGGTLTHSIYIEANSSQTITNAIYVNQPGTITNFLKFNAEGFVSATASGGATRSHKIQCNVGGSSYYMSLYTD